MMEQKVKDITEVLDSKNQVIQILQKEMADKESRLNEQTISLKSISEKYEVTTEQLKLTQESVLIAEARLKEQGQVSYWCSFGFCGMQKDDIRPSP